MAENYELRRRTVEGMVNKLLKDCAPNLDQETRSTLWFQLVSAIINYGNEHFNEGVKWEAEQNYKRRPEGRG